MRDRSRKRLVAVGTGLVLAMVPASAFAHDNLGGDELAAANWMLVGAIITIVIGLLWAVWAFNSGQFSNVEESKYRMLDLAEDYDAIMTASDARERAEREGVRVRTVEQHGDPARVIVLHANSRKADLVVLGSNRRRGWQRFREGSVGERVLRRAAWAVLIVPWDVPTGKRAATG